VLAPGVASEETDTASLSEMSSSVTLSRGMTRPLHASGRRFESCTAHLEAYDSPCKPDHISRAQVLLAERGHDVGIGRARVAAGRSGIAVGYPSDPMIHVSWWALGVVAALTGLWLARRRALSV
jgi:hypothetical protein